MFFHHRARNPEGGIPSFTNILQWGAANDLQWGVANDLYWG